MKWPSGVGTGGEKIGGVANVVDRAPGQELRNPGLTTAKLPLQTPPISYEMRSKHSSPTQAPRKSCVPSTLEDAIRNEVDGGELGSEDSALPRAAAASFPSMYARARQGPSQFPEIHLISPTTTNEEHEPLRNTHRSEDLSTT